MQRLASSGAKDGIIYNSERTLAMSEEKTCVHFRSFGQFQNTLNSHLIVPVRDYYTKRFGSTSNEVLNEVDNLIQAEFCLNFAYNEWQKSKDHLLNLTLQAKVIGWPDNTPITGYHKLAIVKGEEGSIELHRQEWLVSAVLDAFYIFTERITSTTEVLNRTSSNELWKDIKSRSLGYSKGPNSTIEQNLIGQYRSKVGSNLPIDQLEATEDLIVLRGNRTHREHLFVHVRLPENEIVYTDQPHFSIIPITKQLTSKDLELDFNASALFLRWWLGMTVAMCS